MEIEKSYGSLQKTAFSDLFEPVWNVEVPKIGVP